jgi:hypothetical protein
MILLSNQIWFGVEGTPKAFTNFSPGVARASALHWEISDNGLVPRAPARGSNAQLRQGLTLFIFYIDNRVHEIFLSPEFVFTAARGTKQLSE